MTGDPIFRANVHAAFPRPFQVGDECRLWFGYKESPVGVIMAIQDGYAEVHIAGGRWIRIWPVFQLIPAGTTRLTFRHLIFSFIILWKRACAP